MTVQLINIGNVANDGTGDDLREAFIKVNQNFEEIDSYKLEGGELFLYKKDVLVMTMESFR